jgi:ATP-dependent Clp protease ATP-binding subunit ClpA
MAFNRFTTDARLVVQDALEIARELGAPTVEAEHLLLASTQGAGPVAVVLRSSGLDFDSLAAALVAEATRSLAAVGVSVDVHSFSPDVKPPKLATSAKRALEVALRVALERGDKQLGRGHIVLAILRAERGTVPRALECAGVDRLTLRDEVAAAT